MHCGDEFVADNGLWGRVYVQLNGILPKRKFPLAD
jgi:hypothetical protein